jgi:RND family efflux transporter MFP subunit
LSRRATSWACALAALGGLGGCEVAKSEATERAAPPAASPVVVAEVREGRLTDEWVFLGEVQPLAAAELAAGADGEVKRVEVRVGDRVEAGRLLLELDKSLVQARVAAARASQVEGAEELAQAQRDRERAERLGEAVLPQAEIERDVSRAQTLDARTKRLHATAREAKAQLGRHRVVAPFEGVIAARHVDPGDWVAPGDRVLELVDDTRVEIIVAGSAELVRRVTPGSQAVVRSEGSTVAAEIAGVVRALDPTTRTAKLRLVPAEVPPWLMAGASVEVAFAIERDGEGVVVPRDALVLGAMDTRVFEVVEDAVQPVVVRVLATANDDALVVGEGLSPGKRVVVRGNERLRPGQTVRVTADP